MVAVKRFIRGIYMFSSIHEKAESFYKSDNADSLVCMSHFQVTPICLLLLCEPSFYHAPVVPMENLTFIVLFNIPPLRKDKQTNESLSISFSTGTNVPSLTDIFLFLVLWGGGWA